MFDLRIIIIFSMTFCLGCNKEQMPQVVYPERLPITEQAKEFSKMPVYQPPIEGKVIGLQLDDPAPFDGVLLSDTKAEAAAKLRINYDEMYQLALVDRKFLVTVIEIQEKELYRADQIIDYKERQLIKLRDSWWERNKLPIGIAIGVVVGAGLTLATGKIWSLIEESAESN